MLGTVIGFLKKFGGIIMRGIKWVAKQFVENRAVITETAKASAGIATVASSIILATKAIVDSFFVRGKGKKSKNKNKRSRHHVNSNGKVSKRDTRGKKKRREDDDVVSQFRKDLDEHNVFYKSLTPDEQKEFSKLVKKAKDKGIAQSEDFDLEYLTFHTWNPAKSVAWNEWQEILRYSETLAWGTAEGSSARKAIEKVRKAFENRYRSRSRENQSYTGTNFKNMSDRQKAKYSLDAATAAARVREEFDESLDLILENGDLDDERREIINPPEGASVSTGVVNVQEPPDEEVSFETTDFVNVPPEQQRAVAEKLIDAELRSEDDEDDIYVISNLIDPGQIPSYYIDDPQPPEQQSEEGFVSILTWKPGLPHKHAQQEEIEHSYDWSEFFGYRAHPEISSIEDALVTKGGQWCNENLECARVFNDLYFQRPCIYPNHPRFRDFIARFRRCYWDLCLIVPGLGDYGTVFAHPFLGGPDDIEITMNNFEKHGLLHRVYGLNNPPSPEKVLHAILKYSTAFFTANLTAVKENSPVPITFRIRSKVHLADLYYQAILIPEIIEAEIVDPSIYVFLENEFEEYGLEVDFMDDDESDENDPVESGVTMDLDELDADDND